MTAKTSSQSGRHDGIEALQDRLGYRFADVAWLQEALTHSSAAGARTAANERLEFLGDRVLGLVCSERLFRQYPDDTEGELAVRFNALVRKEACAEIAQALDLGAALRMDGSEARTGGRKKAGLLADACEAVIAAIYIDGGLEAARTFIETQWAGAFDAIATLERDPKTELQEWTQERWTTTPVYASIGRSGPDHKPEFEVEVSIPSGERAVGKGASKRIAEKAAAKALLLALRDAP
ncbi:MAG: ribonuclease III [Pseudomonadota bacterium]